MKGTLSKYNNPNLKLFEFLNTLDMFFNMLYYLLEIVFSK